MANDVTIRVRVKEQLKGEIGGLASVLMQTLGGAVIPLSGAVAALGVELAGAGAAAGVFGAAVAPQLSTMKTLSDEQDKVNEAVKQYGEGSKQALAAQQKLKADMDGVPKATLDAAKGFQDLKTKFGEWSNSLAGSTMPVFTHAMNGLKNIFPLLTPLVKSTSDEFLDLSKRFEAFTKTDRFKDLVKQFSDFASGALHNVIHFLEVGAKAAAGFATSQGFKDFVAQGREALPGLAKALQNLAEFIGKFVQAAGPLGGLQLKVFEILASALNSIPTDVLQTLVPLLVGAAGAMKLMKIAMMGFEMVKGLALGFQLLAGATLEVDAAMDANPIGAVVLALTALAVGLKYAWDHSETFREVVQTVFDGIKHVVFNTVKFILSLFKLWLDGWMLVVGGILHGAAKAFGWVPGVGKKLKAADKAFGDLKDGVNSKFDSMINKVSEWDSNVTKGTRERHLKADISDWNSKLEAARRKLKSVPDSKKAKLRGDIADLEAKIRRAQGEINAMHGKTITVRINHMNVKVNSAEYYSQGPHAFGGVIGAAVGGSRSGFTLVGEHGPELVSLPSGSMVHSNPDTRRMFDSMGGGGGGVLQIEWVGGNAGDEFLTWLRRNIRIKGGNVQQVLGANR